MPSSESAAITALHVTKGARVTADPGCYLTQWTLRVTQAKVPGTRMPPDLENEPQNEPEKVLGFWFGTLDAQGSADEEHARRWWRKDPVFDQLIRQEFGALHAAVANDERADWLETPRGTLAAIIVLDQFSRNVFRGSARAFSFDRKALEYAERGVAQKFDVGLATDERAFFYMPFMHSEELAMQEKSLALFRALRDSLEGPARERANTTVDFAERHHDIVRRFGRFPHRNAMLDRTLTAEEIEFLKQPGSAF